PKEVSTYDQKPEMSADEVANKVLQVIESKAAELIIVNFANGDMVGHTGVLQAATQAVETVDACVGKIVDATLAAGGSLVVTADHGNCEQMTDPATGGPHTAHTTFDVPLIVVEPGLEGKTLRQDGRLADIAPTVLTLMGLPIPEEMTGESLISL
ncbi:MAG: sulfatase-like hydrolase/transferase, partial [Rubripirellula sp.]